MKNFLITFFKKKIKKILSSKLNLRIYMENLISWCYVEAVPKWQTSQDISKWNWKFAVPHKFQWVIIDFSWNFPHHGYHFVAIISQVLAVFVVKFVVWVQFLRIHGQSPNQFAENLRDFKIFEIILAIFVCSLQNSDSISYFFQEGKFYIKEEQHFIQKEKFYMKKNE